MNRQQIDAILEPLVKEIFNIDYYNQSINMDNEDNWDSLAHIQLLSALEEAFNLEIQFEDTMEMISISGIVKKLEEYTKN